MASKVLVVGSGCIGLRTTLELLRKRVQVVLRSSRPPLDSSTCSQGAGGLWMPFRCNDERVTKWSIETLDELLAKVSDKEKKEPIEIVPAVMLHKKNHFHPINILPEWTKDKRLEFQHMTLEMLMFQNDVHKLRIPSRGEIEAAGYQYNWLFKTPIVNTTKMLQNMYEEVINHELATDVNTNTGKDFTSMEEIVQEAVENGCDAVVNCTGLGAQSLCNDNHVVGGRGVLLQYDRNCQRRTDDNLINDVAITAEEPPWGGDGTPCYMIPRGDIIVIGGSVLEGDTETSIRPYEWERLERNAHIMGIDTNQSKPIGQWTGFRPIRPCVRLEIDNNYGIDEGVNVVHNYGHGGSGWTVYVGAAKEVSRLLGRGE